MSKSKKVSYEEQTDRALEAAAQTGRAFVEWEAMSQIAINLARIADILRGEDE